MVGGCLTGACAQVPMLLMMMLLLQLRHPVPRQLPTPWTTGAMVASAAQCAQAPASSCARIPRHLDVVQGDPAAVAFDMCGFDVVTYR